MEILVVFEVCFALFVFGFTLTQIIVPLAMNTPLFPMRSLWRKKHEARMQELNDHVDHTIADLEESDIEDFIEKLRKAQSKEK